MNLRGKVAFINGGARIGATVARELARKGCSIAVSYRSSVKSAAETVKDAQGYGVRAQAFKADMTKAAEVKRVIAQIKSALGAPQIVINMASIYEQTPFPAIKEQDWDRIVDANLKSAFLTVKFAAPFMKAGGRVVNFSDWVAASGRPRYKNFVPYFSAKAGVLGLTQAQALELAPHVLVNAIAPGPIMPPTKITNEEVRNIKKATPLGKWGGPLEIAKAVLFLCETDFVTGECVRVDGGRHLY